MAQLHAAIATAREYDPKVLVEAAIDGVEVEVSVLEGIDGAPPDTSLPGQLLVDGGEEFWDFEAKYLDAASGDGDPGADPGRRTSRRSAGWPRPPSTRCPARAWPGWTSSTPPTAGS